jgi:hypothetical protein
MIVKLPEANATSTSYVPGSVAIKPNRFRDNVDVRSYRIEHELSEHPLLQLDGLVELAQRLPVEQREYVFAKQEFGTHEDLAHYRHAGEFRDLSTEQMIRGIETENRVIVLRNVESDPVYGRFVNECLDDLKEQIESVTGAISGRESFIFISPPHAYTPFHYDPEQNFFLQVRGQKQFAIYDVADRDVMPETAIERFYAEDKISKCEPKFFDRHQMYDLEPGDGVYVPVTAPHWVRTLDEVSISISINFRSPSSIRRARVCRANRMLRKMGRSPAPVSPQADAFADRVKSGLLGVPAGLRRALGRS